MSGIVYLIQPPHCLGTSEYKIGMSSSTSIRRVRSYGYETDCIIIRKCSNPSDVEQMLIQAFTKSFGSPTNGMEWFSGNEMDMIKVFNECVDEYATFEHISMNNSYTPPVEEPEPLIPRYTIDELLTKFTLNHVAKISNGVIDSELYDLLNLLSDDILNDEIMIKRIIAALRNKICLNPLRAKNTMHKLLSQRYDSYHGNQVDKWFSDDITATEKRYSLVAFEKQIKLAYPDKYDEWLTTYHISRSNVAKRLKYKRGGFVRLSALKEISPILNELKISFIDRRFEVVIKVSCKTCGNLHKMDCCEYYEASHKTRAAFIKNARLTA
jgi:hypothetical protein